MVGTLHGVTGQAYRHLDQAQPPGAVAAVTHAHAGRVVTPLDEHPEGKSQMAGTASPPGRQRGLPRGYA